MIVDIPEFKRCCCCIPLRPGLLALGYIKLLVSLICLVCFITAITLVTIRFGFMPEILWILFCTLLLLLEISLTIVFLVGSHKKNHKLIRIYYYYSIVVLSFYVLAFIVLMILESIDQWYIENYTMDNFEFMEAKITAGLLNSLIQLYIILLIRSEVRKLKNNAQFKFTNHTVTESQCQMETKNDHEKNNITNDTNTVLDSNAINKINSVPWQNNKNVNSDDHLYLNKYIKMKNEE